MHSHKWLRVTAICAVMYPLVGTIFGALGNPSISAQLRIFWRFAAWFASAGIFAVHFFYEYRRLHSHVMATALHSSLGVAVGAFLLAAWINIHELWAAAAQHSPRAPLAFIIFPLVTGLPAFIVAFVAGAILDRIGGNR